MTAHRTRFVVVGAGHMGAHHIKKIVSEGRRIGARVSAVVEPDELRGLSVVRSIPEADRPQLVSNLGELSALGAKDFPDAAIVAVPASIHVETTQACLRRGLHCLVEKPLGFSALDVKDLDREARQANRILQVGLLERWALANLWGDWVPEKKGPFTVSCFRYGPFVPRAADTDVIHDLMIHDLDLFVMLGTVLKFPKMLGVRAWGRKLRSDFLDYAAVSLDFEDGGSARFFASRLSAENSRQWELTGPDWHASIDFMRRQLWRFVSTSKWPSQFEPKERQWPSGDPLGLEIEAFCHRIRGDFAKSESARKIASTAFAAEDLLPTPSNVLATHELIDEILSSIKVLSS